MSSRRFSYGTFSPCAAQNSRCVSHRRTAQKTRAAAKFLELWLPVIIWAIFIFILSNIPYLKSGFKCDLILRKSAHITEYFVLTFLLYRALKNSFDPNMFCSFIFPFGASFLYAGSDEVHQLFILGRHGCVQDVLIDAIGILGFYVAILYSSRIYRAVFRLI